MYFQRGIWLRKVRVLFFGHPVFLKKVQCDCNIFSITFLMLPNAVLHINSQENYLASQYNQTKHSRSRQKKKTPKNLSSWYSKPSPVLKTKELAFLTQFGSVLLRAAKTKGLSLPLPALFEGQSPSPLKTAS
ncbi:hypothetical protein TNCV_3090131 [Trichonephila clavipes]|nr:hypothetical protein TNCV_3090131 [Trichonephila clavipes]